jgi:hypothetical protein
MAELLLDHVHGHAFVDELGGVRMPQAVRVNALVDARPGSAALDHLANLVGAQRAALQGAEQPGAPVPELGALGEPELHHGDGAVVDRHGAVVVASSALTAPVCHSIIGGHHHQ